MLRAELLDSRSRRFVIAEGQCGCNFIPDSRRQHGRRDAHDADGFSSRVRLADDTRHFGNSRRLAALDGKVAEVLGRAEASRKDQRVDVVLLQISHGDDLSPRNSRRFDPHVSLLAGGLAAEMVHDVQVHVGCGHEYFGSRPVEGEKRDHRFVNFRAVKYAATRKHDSHLGHGHSFWGMALSRSRLTKR